MLSKLPYHGFSEPTRFSELSLKFTKSKFASTLVSSNRKWSSQKLYIGTIICREKSNQAIKSDTCSELNLPICMKWYSFIHTVNPYITKRTQPQLARSCSTIDHRILTQNNCSEYLLRIPPTCYTCANYYMHLQACNLWIKHQKQPMVSIEI